MAQSGETRLDSFEALLDEFEQLPSRVARPPTFMEIAGYPHYENACSNILAFFMDPEEAHGLGTLMLDALASATGFADGEGVGGNVSVEREVGTEAGNRIDLLIESDTRAILVENKIYAVADNPFEDYADYLNRRILDGRPENKVLLTVFSTPAGSRWGFVNLTYEELVGQIRSLLGLYLSSAEARYLTMFLDFLNTLENLKKGSRMDQQFVRLLAERGDDVRELFNDLKSFRADLRNKVEELQNLINASQYPSVEKQSLWRGDTVQLADNLAYRIRIAEDLLIGVYARLDPNGWRILIVPREKGDPSKLKALLQNLEIPFKEGKYFVHSARFDYNEDLDRVRQVLQDLVDKLATSQEPEVKS